jgi:hypothetical protein
VYFIKEKLTRFCTDTNHFCFFYFNGTLLHFSKRRNYEVLLIVEEQRNILHEINKRKANWIGHILRTNCLLQRAIEGKTKGRTESLKYYKTHILQ